MSLRSVGNQLLQTAPSPLLAGAATASLSLWVRVNPGCNVANSNGVNIFGDTGGKLSATLSGSGNLQLGWSSNNGTTNGQSTCNLTLAPGTSYHLAAVWQDGSQQYFVNGVQIDSDTQPGSIGVLGDAAPHPFRLGSDSAGTDVTLDEPTLWVGYALSVQDVRNLRDRIVHPEGVAPASIALQWSLAGADGVTARIGDAGLTDSSATGLNLSSIVGSAPTYQAGVLSYAPVAAIGSASVGPSGRSIVVVVEDGTGAPANVKSLQSADNTQLLSLSGAPAGGGFTLTFGGQTTATIPVPAAPPIVYGTWTASVAAGVAQQVAATWIGLGWEPTSQLFEVFDSDGTTLLGSTSVDMTRNPADFTDGTNPAGNPTRYKILGTFTPTGAVITVRISSPAGQYVLADGLWVKNTSTGAIQYLDDSNPSAFSMAGAGSTSGQGAWYNGTYTAQTGTGAGPRYSVDPAAIQAALLALSSVQAGGVTVTAADSHNSSPYTVKFGGPMGGVPQPLLIASDPAISPSLVTPGGNYPSIRINGGAPIQLESPVWGVGLPGGAGTRQYPPYNPHVLWPLPQSAPSTQFALAFSGLFSTTAPYYYGGAGYANPTLAMAGSSTATFTFPCRPAGKYRVAITWPTNAGLSSSGTYTVGDNSGTLATGAMNQSVAPADFIDAGVGWKVLGTYTLPSGTDISVTLGAGGGTAWIDSARLDRISADTSVVIKPTDVVTLSALDGWASTAAGPVDGATSLPLRNLVGGAIIPPLDPSSVTMPVGWNASGSSSTGWCLVHANLAKGMSWQVGGIYATNPDGYPTVLTGSYLDNVVYSGVSDVGGNGKFIPAIPGGNYTFVWDGTCDVGVSPTGPTTTATSVSSSLTGTTNNRRVFNIQGGVATYSPLFSLRVHGTGPDPSDASGKRHLTDLTNLRIYPPDIDPDNAPLFHPTYISKFGKAKSIRTLNMLDANIGNIKDFTDIHPRSAASYIDPVRVINVPIAEITAYKGSSPSGFDPVNGVVLQVTTASPHGLGQGQTVSIINGGDVTLSNGSYTTTINSYLTSTVNVVSPTVFLVAFAGDSGHPNRVMTNTLTGGDAGQVYCLIGALGGMCFADLVSLCNQVGADMYLNVPVTAGDACVTAMAGYVAANLDPGLKCRVEYGNECWNYSPNNYEYCCMMGTLVLGVGPNYYPPYYVYRMKQVHDLCAAAFTSAGRPGDFVRIMGTLGADPGTTANLLSLATTAYPTKVDELAVAPYLDNCSVYGYVEPTLTPIYNLMTIDQVLDLFELNILYGRTEIRVSDHRPILDAAGFTSTKMICYEGGPDDMLPRGNTTDINRRNHAVARHPRMYTIMLGFLKKLQDAGCSLYNDFILNYYPGPAVWGAYYGWNMRPGTGNPATDAINIADPEALDQINSEVGGAMSYWASLMGGPTPPPTTKPKRTIPGRNGQIRAIGFPRGLFRPTR